MTNIIKRVFGMLTAIAMGFALTSSAAYARSTELIRFNLPTATSVKGKIMPAGAYTIRDMGLWSGVPVLQISSDDNKIQVIAFAHMKYSADLQASEKSVATFRYDGTAYRLESVRVAGTNLSYQLSSNPEQD
jgi:hypothetical protein